MESNNINTQDTRPAIVCQSNELVEANYKLTPNEQKLVLCLASNIDRNAEDFQTVRMPAKLVSELCGFNVARGYNDLQKVMLRLLNRSLVIRYREGSTQKGWFGTHWVQKCKFLSSGKGHEAYVEFKFDEDLVPHLLQLKERYLRSELHMLVSFNHVYSTRFYMLFRNQIKLHQRKLTFQRIRELLQLPKSYENTRDLKKKVIKVAVQEINEKSDMEISYTYYKEGGRADVGAIFSFQLKKSKRLSASPKSSPACDKVYENEYESLRHGMSDEEKHMLDRLVNVAGITPDTAQKMIQQYGVERCQRNLEAQRKKDTTNNLGGLVISAINEDWAGKQRAYKAQIKADKELKEKERREAAGTQAAIEKHIQRVHEEAEEEPQQISKQKKVLSKLIVNMLQASGKANGLIAVTLKAGGWTADEVLDGTYDKWLQENKNNE